jgi:hypothetical protein
MCFASQCESTYIWQVPPTRFKPPIYYYIRITKKFTYATTCMTFGGTSGGPSGMNVVVVVTQPPLLEPKFGVEVVLELRLMEKQALMEVASQPTPM